MGHGYEEKVVKDIKQSQNDKRVKYYRKLQDMSEIPGHVSFEQKDRERFKISMELMTDQNDIIINLLGVIAINTIKD